MNLAMWWWLVPLLLVLAAVLPLRRGQDLLAAAGLAAIAPGLLLLAAPVLAREWQVLTWLAAGVLLVCLWRGWLLPRRRAHQQQALARQDAIGEAGTVVRPPEPGKSGLARFEPPLLGRSDWLFECAQTVTVGDLVFVSEAGKNVLTVVRLDGS